MCLSVEIPVHRCRYAKEASHSMTTRARSVNEEIRRVKLNGPRGGMKKGVWGDRDVSIWKREEKETGAA